VVVVIQTADPDISDAAINRVREVLKEGTLSTGEIVSEFEDHFSSFVGLDYGAAVCSGGTALELAFESTELSAGDEVVVSPRNCASVLYSMLNQDLNPVFADVDPHGMNLDTESVESVLNNNNCSVEALLVTHLHGSACNIERLTEIAERHDLTLIEDISQSPGVTYRGQKLGTFGSMAVCSFGATKNISTGEGGMIVSDDEELIEHLHLKRSSRHGEASVPLRSVRMSDIEAAIGIEQLNRYDELVTARRRVAKAYDDTLKDTISVPEWSDVATHVYLNYPIFVENPNKLSKFLLEKGIETATYDTLLSDYECLPEKVERNFPHAREVVNRAVALPVHSKLSVGNACEVTEAVNSFV